MYKTAESEIKKNPSNLPILKRLSRNEMKELIQLLSSDQPNMEAIHCILSRTNVVPFICTGHPNGFKVQILTEALKLNTTIIKVDLRSKIDHIGAQAIAQALKVNTTIRKINLSWNHIGDIGAQAIAQALKENTAIREIHLSWSNIGDIGAQAIAEALKVNRTIREIDLSRNNIGDIGAQAIAQALKENTAIREIHLSWSNIGDIGAQAIAEALKVNRTIREIDLSFNNIGDIGAQAVAEALKVNRTIRKIDLRKNYFIENMGYQSIILTLYKNCIITDIRLDDVREDEKTRETILQFMNHSLRLNQDYQQSLALQIQKMMKQVLHMIPAILIPIILGYYDDEKRGENKIKSDIKEDSFSLNLIKRNSSVVNLIHEILKQRCWKKEETTWKIPLSIFNKDISLRDKLYLRDVIMQIFYDKKMDQATADINFDGDLVLTSISENLFENLVVTVKSLLSQGTERLRFLDSSNNRHRHRTTENVANCLIQ